MPRLGQCRRHGNQHLGRNREQARHQRAQQKQIELARQAAQRLPQGRQQHQAHRQAAALQLVAQRGQQQQACRIGHLGQCHAGRGRRLADQEVSGNRVQQRLVEIIAACTQAAGQCHQQKGGSAQTGRGNVHRHR
ncbi:hypothetical protein SDC9_156991 [bioreactor metagenome]|uniref:Uncharacterized protein n=1 Tax=bioreactor metagenome TaxID=1076179 RepID=A0A645F8P8_9ZZZZ